MGDDKPKRLRWIEGTAGVRRAWLLVNQDDQRVAVVTQDGRKKFRWNMSYHLASTQSSGKKKTLEEAQAMCVERAFLVRPIGRPLNQESTPEGRLQAAQVLAVGAAMAQSALK